MSEVNLPEGWTLARYEDVYLSASNGTGGTQNKDGLGIPVSRIETIASENIDYDRIGFLAAYDKDKVEKHKLVKGDILFSHINSPIHLGKTAIYDGKHPLYHGINLLRIIVNRQIACPRIFNWHCKYTRFQGEFSLRAQHAVNQSSINQKKLGAFEIALPPLAEQAVIADRLDTLLAQVETTKARLERIPQILKRFRQSVLAAAVSGELTEDPANKFREVSVEEVAKEEKYSLGIGPFGSNLKVSDYRETGHPLVFVREIRARKFGDAATKFVSSEKFEALSAHRVCPGDILITKMGDPPGDVAIYPLERPEAVITSDCIKLSVNESVADRDYIAYAMQAESFRRSVLSISAGVAHQKVSLTKFRKLRLLLPPLEQQLQIVQRIDLLFAHADRIEQQVQAAQERVNNLTQSILAKAFRGELTEQWRKDNPELISGENSAAALLERIQAERATNNKTRKTPRLAKKPS